jgi:tRNA/tmRNA/rRNA uracil-C5-methylase (TrmA/RlmC/RlmD family)
MMRLKTESTLAAGGDAIARAPDGRIVFIENAAPEEEVRVEITRDNPRFLRARAIEILTPSPHRVVPRCRHFGECGGCTLQHVDHATQVASKHAAVLETLRRIGRIDTGRLRIDPPWTGEPYGYRTRVRFSVKRGKAGYKRKKSNEVFDATECPILAEPLERLLVEHDRKREGEVSAILEEDRVVLSDRFAQANEQGNQAMLAHVEALLAELGPFESALELYGGSGNFTLVLTAHARRVTMVESNRDATRRAKKMLPAVEILELEVEEAPDAPVDLVLVDPPRAGMSGEALDRAARAASRALVYVSCDPATFARDAARLADRSLALDAIRLFDLYPQTAHAEVVGRFRRKP